MISWLATVVVLFSILWVYFEPDSRLKHYGELLPGPKRWPIVGNMLTSPKNGKGINSLEICANYLKFRTWLISLYGPVCRYWAGNILIVSLSDANDIEVILKHPKEIKKPFIGYEFFKGWLGSGLLISSGETWFLRRKALTPAFYFKLLEQFMGVFNRKALELVAELKKQTSSAQVDLFRSVNKTTLDLLYNLYLGPKETVMGSRDSVTDEEFTEYKNAVQRLIHLVMDRVAKPIMYNDTVWKYCGGYKEERRCMETLKLISEKVIHEKEKATLGEVDRVELKATEEGSYQGIKPKMGSLDIMLRLKLDGNPAFMTNADVLEEANNLFFAGHDTVATSACFTMDMLARHQDIQQELYQEIESNIPDLENLKTSDVQSLPFMERVIKESLRLFPPVPVIGRHILKDVQLPSGYTVPGGSMVAISIFHLHRKHEYYENPEDFNPDNFLPEAVEKRPPYAFVPFSAGPRNCIGKKFGLLELKTILVTVVKNFKLLPTEDAEPDLAPYGSITLQLEGGHKVRLVERMSKCKH